MIMSLQENQPALPRGFSVRSMLFLGPLLGSMRELQRVFLVFLSPPSLAFRERDDTRAHRQWAVPTTSRDSAVKPRVEISIETISSRWFPALGLALPARSGLVSRYFARSRKRTVFRLLKLDTSEILPSVTFPVRVQSSCV